MENKKTVVLSSKILDLNVKNDFSHSSLETKTEKEI